MTETTPRIAPVTEPYTPDVAESLSAMMPKHSPIPPLALFRTLVRNQPLAERMKGMGSLLLGRSSSLEPRIRELVIQRTCARCGCSYEWGVHVAAYAARLGITDEQVSSAADSLEAHAWDPTARAALNLVDALHETANVSDDDWAAARAEFSEEQLLELLVLVGWYHTIAYVANAARVELEPWAPTLPAA